MKHALLALALLSSAAYFWPARADDDPAKNQKSAATDRNESKHAFLGVEVESLPAALSSQSPATFPKGQGVLVVRVRENSPAAKAGLQAYDVLMSYGNEKLHSPQELMNLLNKDTSGHDVTIAFIRGGKSKTCTVKLGERPTAPAERSRVFRLAPIERFQQVFEEFQAKNGSSDWESFDATDADSSGCQPLARGHQVPLQERQKGALDL
jgi:PDZ domain-containing secreted protein